MKVRWFWTVLYSSTKKWTKNRPLVQKCVSVFLPVKKLHLLGGDLVTCLKPRSILM